MEVWTTFEKWAFQKTEEEGFVNIKNINTRNVLEATNDGKVIEKVLVKGKPEQMWKIGDRDEVNFYTIESYLRWEISGSLVLSSPQNERT